MNDFDCNETIAFGLAGPHGNPEWVVNRIMSHVKVCPSCYQLLSNFQRPTITDMLIAQIFHGVQR